MAPRPFLIGGRFCRADDDTFVDALAKAYAARTRPGCLCRPSRPAMSIARIGPRFILKRMPGTGTLHAPTCPSWQTLAADAAATKRPPPSTVPKGLASLRVDFRWTTAQHFPGQQASDESGSPTTSPKSMSIGEFLHDLWNRADLTRWRLSDPEQRSWTTVRARLLKVAAGLAVNGQPLLPRLFMPEPFDLDRRQEIYARRRALWNGIRYPSSGPRSLTLLIAELKAIATIQRDRVLTLRHIPDKRFRIETAALNPIPESRNATGAHSCDTGRMICIATVDVAGRTRPIARDLFLMQVDSLWRPVNTSAAPTGSELHVHSLRETI